MPTVQLGLAGRAGGSSCLAMAMRATGGYTNRLNIIIKKGYIVRRIKYLYISIYIDILKTITDKELDMDKLENLKN